MVEHAVTGFANYYTTDWLQAQVVEAVKDGQNCLCVAALTKPKPDH